MSDIGAAGGGTVTSVGVQNGGGLTISGSPVTSSGTITVGHSNSVTAQSTEAIRPIAIDANGHISSYGSAVTIPDAELFVVNATITTVSDGVPTGGTTDKSATEIYNAATSGKLPVVKVQMQSTGVVQLIAPLSLTESVNSSAYAVFTYEDQLNDTFQYARLYVTGSTFTITFVPPYIYDVTNEDGLINVTDSSVQNMRQIVVDHAKQFSSMSQPPEQAVYPFSYDEAGHITSAGNAVTIPTAGTTATAVSTTASGGSASTYSKSDHVHSLSSSTVTSALGYTPYNSTNPNGYTSNAGTVTGVTAGTGLTGGTISASGTIALDTTRAITASDISTGTDTTNKLVSAKTISDALGAASGGGFKITLTYNQDYTIDKTFAEVGAAVAANKYVYVYDATGTQLQADVLIGHYIGMGQGDYVFQCINDGYYVFYSIWDDDGQTEVSVWNENVDSGQTIVGGTSPVSVSTFANISTVYLSNGYGDTKNPYGTKSANTVLAGPVSGSAAAPTFRELVRSDQFVMVTPQDLTDSQYLDYIAQSFPNTRFAIHTTSGGEEIFAELYSVGPVNHETTWIGFDTYGIRYWEFNGSGTKVTDNYFEYPTDSGTLALEGGNDFFITLSYDDLEEEYSVDKTFLEIDAAYAAGKKLYMILPEDNYLMAYQGGLAPIPLTETFWSPDPVSETLLGMYVFSAEYPFSSKPTDVNGSRNSICVSIDDSDTLRVGEYPVKNIEITKANPTTLTTYYGVFTDYNTGTLFRDGGSYNGIVYMSRAGTTSTNGISALVLGNGTNFGSNGNRYGYISLYPQSGNYTNSIVSTGTLTANRTLTLPDKSGTLATTDDITAAINALDASNTSY